jgi:Tfp pilus assembly protein PilN
VKPVNLIPSDQRRRTPSQGKGAPIALGVLGLLLVMVVGYILTSNTVTDRQDKADATAAEADAVEAQAAKQTSYTNFAQIAVQRTQSVAGVAASRFDWERFMRELAHVMPEGSWLQSADASVNGDPTSTGAAPAATPGEATVVQPAANLIGCTPDQDDVARMMVRLGELYRVEDVELNESSKGTGEDTPTVDACGPLYTFNLTVKFSAADPARETPRGATRVPATLGGGR